MPDLAVAEYNVFLRRQSLEPDRPAGVQLVGRDTDLGAEDIVKKAMAIAADICVYTNSNVTIETLASTK